MLQQRKAILEGRLPVLSSVIMRYLAFTPIHAHCTHHHALFAVSLGL